MAKQKKAIGKTKAKRKKTLAKASTRKKTTTVRKARPITKKTARKASLPEVSPRKAKPIPAKPTPVRPTPTPRRPQPVPAEQRIGVVRRATWPDAERRIGNGPPNNSWALPKRHTAGQRFRLFCLSRETTNRGVLCLAPIGRPTCMTKRSSRSFCSALRSIRQSKNVNESCTEKRPGRCRPGHSGDLAGRPEQLRLFHHFR